MQASTTEHAALLGVAPARAIAVVVGEGLFTLWSSFVCLTLLLVLYVFNPRNDPSRAVSWAFGAVCALCITSMLGVLIDWFTNPGKDEPPVSPNSIAATNGGCEL